MTIPTIPVLNNATSQLYEIGLFIGVAGTLILNIATLIKNLSEKKVSEQEVEGKAKMDEANATAVSIQTALDLLPPLKARIKELETQVKGLEEEVKRLKLYIEDLTGKKQKRSPKKRNVANLGSESQKTQSN